MRVRYYKKVDDMPLKSNLKSLDFFFKQNTFELSCLKIEFSDFWRENSNDTF